MPSLAMPNGAPRNMIPLPGAVWPAIVTYGSLHDNLPFKWITPPTSNTMVRGPDTLVIPYLNVPSAGLLASSSSDVTWYTVPPRPPIA